MSSELTGPERDIVVACLVGDEPGAYNIPVFVRFDEPVDCARFARAADAVLAASPALRSRFVRDGRTIRRAPASAARTERLRARRDELSAVAAARRIEVTDEVLVRSAVIELDAPAPVYFFLNIHHALADGLSLSLLLRAILEAYATGTVQVLSGPVDAAPSQASEVQVSDRHTADDADHDGLGPWTPTAGPTAAFLTALSAHRVPGLGVSVTERIIETESAPAFADALAAAVPAIGDWLGVSGVVVSTALAGRSVADLRSLGNFVRLQPLHLDARAIASGRGEQANLGDLARRLVLASSTPRRPDAERRTAVDRAAEVAVVFDYKRESLIARRIHPGLASYIVADDGYVDPKYDLHVSLYQCGTTQYATLTARDLPPAEVSSLLDAYAARLTSQTSVPSVRPGAPRATAPQEALRACS